jgi:hypothetical protein
MDYNTQREPLKLPEYGRHIHKMVDYIKTIHDNDLRNNMAKAMIDVMGNMNPHLRDVPEFRHKLWDHLAIMSNFELDIDWPYDLPKVNAMNEKPEKVPYSNGKFRYKHYGRNLQNMLKIVNEFDEETRKMLIEQLANHMKISYVNWKNEPVNDEYIFDDIQKLTNGEIEIPKNLSLNEVKQPKIAKPTNPKSKKKKYKKNPKY